MNRIYEKRLSQPLFIENFSGKPEIVLVFPITRDGEGSLGKWQTVLEFVGKSEIGMLLVIDKTERLSATEYFMKHFTFDEKKLYILPRSIKDTLFDTVGEIVLDKNVWIIQLHDDDYWHGKISLPETVNSGTVYFFDFYLHAEKRGVVQIKDYFMPNRIVFSLVPSSIWNKFSQLVRDQDYHVAGSFDFTLNKMVQLSCKFEHQQGFQYYWKDDNWKTPKEAVSHLKKLAESDGWKEWSSPEIANLNRSIDCLASLNYLKDLLNPEVIENEINELLRGFQPTIKRRLKYMLLNPILQAEMKFRVFFVLITGAIDQRLLSLQKQSGLHKFIERTWKIESLESLIDLIEYMAALNRFGDLHRRFEFWKSSLSKLNERI